MMDIIEKRAGGNQFAEWLVERSLLQDNTSNNEFSTEAQQIEFLSVDFLRNNHNLSSLELLKSLHHAQQSEIVISLAKCHGPH